MRKGLSALRPLLRSRAGVLSALSYALSLVLLGIALAGADGNGATLGGERVRAPETSIRLFTYPASIFILLGLVALGTAMYFLVRCESQGKPPKTKRYSRSTKHGRQS